MAISMPMSPSTVHDERLGGHRVGRTMVPNRWQMQEARPSAGEEASVKESKPAPA